MNFQAQLNKIAERGNLRTLPQVEHRGAMMVSPTGEEMLNLSSNDYLALATHKGFAEGFWREQEGRDKLLSASSSRLLTGNFSAYTELENLLMQLYGAEAALVFNSGYHTNSGILPAITTSHSLILADKLVHASLIDGIQLAAAKCIRYRHNDYTQLERLLATHAAQHDRVVVVTESIFSMDGDRADLPRLVALKRTYPNLLLYVDEAHAVGAVGEQGLGCAEECGCLADIDLLVGTFGKALASVGAYLICSTSTKAWLVNTMRTLIFTTALPPFNLAWSHYVMSHLHELKGERERLAELSQYLVARLGAASQVSRSHIIPFIVGDSAEAVKMAEALQREGFYVLAVRPPTVPEGTSRLRLSLTASLTLADMDRLLLAIDHYKSSHL